MVEISADLHPANLTERLKLPLRVKPQREAPGLNVGLIDAEIDWRTSAGNLP
jgi:hypothetical protein